MTKMKQAMGLAILLLGASILVGCGGSPIEETKPPQAGAAPPSGGGTAPGTNTNKSTKATVN